MVPFKLIEFQNPHAETKISGVLSEHQTTLSLSFKLEQAHLYELPEFKAHGERKDELWKATCFEVFIRPHSSEKYVEFNLAPNGDWNAYEFDSYRASNKGETPHPIELDKAPQMATTGAAKPDQPWRLDTQIDLKGLPAEYLLSGARMIGISVVLLDLKGNLSYFALSHPEAKADFHDPKGHILRL